MTKPKALLLTTLVTLLLATALVPGAWAQGPVPEDGREARFGMIGLARLQIARLTVVNHNPVPTFSPDPSRPPCRVTLGFVDGAGTPFANAAGVAIAAAFDVTSGGVASLDLTTANAFRGRTGSRVQFRPTVEFQPIPNDGSPDPCGFVAPMLEIVDSIIARTTLATPLERTERGEPVDYDRIYLFGVVGLTRGQIARLNVVNLALAGGEECRGFARMEELKESGEKGGTADINLLPQNALSVDLSWTDVFPREALRVPISAEVILPPEPPAGSSNPCAAMVATLEIFDAPTGRTQIFLKPQRFTPPIRVSPGSE